MSNVHADAVIGFLYMRLRTFKYLQEPIPTGDRQTGDADGGVMAARHC